MPLFRCNPTAAVQPLCAMYRTRAGTEGGEQTLRAQSASPPLRAILDLVRASLIPFSDLADLPNAEHLFLNVNTPAI